MAQIYKYSASSSPSVSLSTKPAPSSANLIAGVGPTGALTPLSVDASGNLNIDVAVSVPIDVNASQAGTWNINNVSGTISLPTGAATAAKQDTGNSSLASIDSKTPALGQALAAGSVPVVLTADQLSTLTPLSTVAATQSGTWNINNVSGTISLPTGAATSAKQPALGTAGSASSDVITVQGIASMVALKVDGSGVTQPISAASLPLPSGASSASNQTDGSQKTQIVDGSGNVIGATSNALNVNISSGSVTATNPSVSTTASAVPASATYVGANKSGNLVGLTLDGSSNLNVNVAAGTVAATINTGVISAGNSTTTPLGSNATFTGSSEEVTQYAAIGIGIGVDRSGVLNFQFSNDGTNWDQDQAYTVTVTTPGVTQGFYFQSAAEAKYFRVVYVNGATAQGVFRLQSVYKTASPTADVSYLAVPPIDAANGLTTKSVIYGKTTGGGGGFVAVKVNPSGALSAAIGDISGIVGQATMANSVPVVIASNQSAVPVSQSTTPWVSNITQVNGSTLALGQATMVNSLPVAIASNQSSIPANINQIGGSSLALGQTVMASSVPVTLASNQSALTVAQATAASLNATVVGTGTFAVQAASVGTGSANAPVYNDYTSTSVTTSAYVQLVASTSNAINNVHIFDSSGQAMILAIGAAGSEVDTLFVPPGGDTYNLNIPASSRISYKAKTANATSGYLLMSFLK